MLGDIRFSGEWMGALQAGPLHPWRPPDPEVVLERFGRPVLILHGAKDMVFPVQVAERLRAAVPRAQLDIIEGAGHMAQFERPDAWAAAVLRFLGDAH